jgi:hypothetical protein
MRLHVVLGRAVAPEELQPAMLDGFRHVRVADETFPCLVADGSGKVSGVVLESKRETEQQRSLALHCERWEVKKHEERHAKAHACSGDIH